MNELYNGDCLDVLKEMHHHKQVQIPGKGSQTTFKQSVKRVNVEEEEGLFDE